MADGGFATRLKSRIPEKEQGKLAGKVGVSTGSMSNWVNGKGGPDPDELKSICRELGVTPNWLLDWRDEDTLTEEEWEFIFLLRRLTPVQRGPLRTIMSGLVRD